MAFPSQIHAPELIPSRWTVLEDVQPLNFRIEDLEFVSFLRGRERCIGGEEMRRRAVELRGNLGLADGKRILAEQEKIPVELRGKYIPLTGTLLLFHGGGLEIPYLIWGGDLWIPNFGQIDGDWCSDARLARPKSAKP